ncbi:putative integral membrane protein (TIGR00698 family) [Curtobacterium sp. PhB172]|uniref:YeiH family protein n=1 Tax=unclassified Curtobacterium TaxID=257496 RepID=UPI000F4656F3|nr:MULTISPECIES: putative sulfate exporter family transporter [unclassified Curtobacterium]ROQ18251.1 putative integral membrane protein (TIGR00698 family) [Curtobacterium sp. PhB171]ROQ30211.1 putative integral membrane protein (TIGR00698 family) [Curtobacterium sp. PhB170]ROS32417.1 putative integral membrane protein (TIGR00698 family) [Curtobacterium sp. PhB131]ROS58712.1 putative integral membrane protein (TIGR00698 family) [Curtobacterium sp. PhB172]ROS63633.1 putative integral membrane p
MQFARTAAPGVAVAVAIGLVATLIGSVVPVVGGPVPAVLIGAVLGWLVRRRTGGTLAVLAPGVKFSSSRVLQFAVVLLGAQLSIGEVLRIGGETLPVMVTTLVVCLGAAWGIGRLLRVSSALRTLIGVGTGICGASAIAAVTPVIGAVSADVAYAMSTIFLCNIAAVFAFPLLGHALGLSQHAFGVFAGTAVNDTSSVVATATVYGRQATDTAVVVKLVRTLMIIPIVIGLAGLEARRASREQLAPDAGSRSGFRVFRLVPWFLIGFLVVVLLRTVGVLPADAAPGFSTAASFLITVALAAIGCSTDFAALRRAGFRPMLLGIALWVLVAGTSLGAQAVFGLL